MLVVGIVLGIDDSLFVIYLIVNFKVIKLFMWDFSLWELLFE